MPKKKNIYYGVNKPMGYNPSTCVGCKKVEDNGWVSAINMDVFANANNISGDDLCFDCLKQLTDVMHTPCMCMMCEKTLDPDEIPDDTWTKFSGATMHAFMTSVAQYHASEEMLEYYMLKTSEDLDDQAKAKESWLDQYKMTVCMSCFVKELGDM